MENSKRLHICAARVVHEESDDDTSRQGERRRNSQFEEPTLSVCTRPSSTRDWRTSFTDCETVIIRDKIKRIYSASFIPKEMYQDQKREETILTEKMENV